MQNNFTSIDKLNTQDFIKNIWQQKPLVIRQGFKNFRSPISAEELAGLACEEDVHSRIVIEKGGAHPWQLINGPMAEELFATLPETHWTLLVNDVEKHLPQLAWIVDAFRFIPEWRVDDLMISYAPEGGTVGPHLDQYDVFILQAQGQRLWQTNSQPVSEDNQLENTNLKIQKDFKAEQQWLLEPGDIIYIPPGVSHYGVAKNDCLSFSIGFRAPTHAEMLTSFIDFIANDLPTDKTWKDKNLSVQKHPNEITQDAINNMRKILKEYLNPEHPALAEWFGRFVSDTKTDLVFENEQPFKTFEDLKQTQPVLIRNPASRFAFINNGDKTMLFIDRHKFSVNQLFAQTLCAQRELRIDDQNFEQTEQQLIVSLYNNGSLLPIN